VYNQAFSPVTPVDVIQCGDYYGIAYGLIGLEAHINRTGRETLASSPRTPKGFVYAASTIKMLAEAKRFGQHYAIGIDGQTMEGSYASIMVANCPNYGKRLAPAADADPRDGILDIYTIKDTSRFKLAASLPKYVSGRYAKAPGVVEHYRGKSLFVDSQNVMCMSIDGEVFYEKTAGFTVIPGAVDFVTLPGAEAKQ
jgi:diacylglycerol kinase family enzyme